MRAKEKKRLSTIEQLEQFNTRLIKADKLKDEFLAKTSHELRTPLYGMIGLVEVLINRSSKVEPEVQMLLNVVLQSGRHLSRLVADMMDYSRLYHQNIKLALQPVALRLLVDVVFTLCKPMIKEQDMVLVNAIAADCPAVLADEARLEQILFNLIGNAIKFTQHGKVTVSTRQIGNELLIQVTDTGIGIEPEQQDKISNYLYRLTI